MTSDPISDMLTRIRNGLAARHPKVDVPASRLKTDIAKILKNEGFIANYKLTEEGAKKSIRIYLKYTPGNVPVISRIGWIGYQYPHDPSRRHDRRNGAQRRRRRRITVSRLVGVCYV